MNNEACNDACAWFTNIGRAAGVGVAMACAGLAFAAAPPNASHSSAIVPLAAVHFVKDDDVPCLKSALENGAPESGPSTFLLLAPPGCEVPAHYHTAEEQLIVIRGEVFTAMAGMPGSTLAAGGFAAMASKAVHRFSCRSKIPCLMIVTFDRRYDIFWAESGQPPRARSP